MELAPLAMSSIDVSSIDVSPEEVWAQVSQVHQAAATEVTLVERFWCAMNAQELVGLQSGSHRASGRVVGVTGHAVILNELGGARSWWARAHLAAITGLPRGRGSGRALGEGRWWRGVRSVDLATVGGEVLRGRVEWVGADHLDVRSGERVVSYSWPAIAWARSIDAWLYDE